VTVWPCIAPSGDEKPHVNFDVEKDKSCEGENSQEHSPGDVHVVLNVNWVIPEKRKFKTINLQHQITDTGTCLCTRTWEKFQTKLVFLLFAKLSSLSQLSILMGS
jgi:hypothetical protein